MNKKLVALLFFCAAALAVTCLWVPAKRMAAHAAAKSTAAGQVALERPVVHFVKDPEPVPPFLVHDLNGDVVTPAAWKGKVTLLVFWATWCGPCREEIPELIDLEKKYLGQAQVIGISVDEAPPSAVKEFVEKKGINYPVAMSTAEIERGFGGIAALPTVFVVNKDVGIVQKHVGVYPTSLFDDEIRVLLGNAPETTIETFVDEGQIFLKNAANASEYPGVDISLLNADQKKVFIKRMNAESCTCGCRLTLAQCRINDTSCPISKEIATKMVEEVRTGKPAPALPAGPPGSGPAN